MHIKLGFVHPPDATAQPDFGETYRAMVKLSRPSLVSATPVCIRYIHYVM
jgi:phosphatidylserine decarboxylase